MTGRTVATIEWVLAAILLIWFVVFLLTQASSSLTLGLVVSSLFFAPGLALSLAINGLVHFRRRESLAASEKVALGVEALIIVILVVASVVDQLTVTHGNVGNDFGRWLEWFLVPWLLIGPVAITVLLLGLMKGKPRGPVL
jgi:predicted membrane channel-forming protein YqfA (hemolysin III family)